MFQGKTDAKCSGLRREMITSRIPQVLRNVAKTPIPSPGAMGGRPWLSGQCEPCLWETS